MMHSDPSHQATPFRPVQVAETAERLAIVSAALVLANPLLGLGLGRHGTVGLLILGCVSLLAATLVRPLGASDAQ